MYINQLAIAKINFKNIYWKALVCTREENICMSNVFHVIFKNLSPA